MGRGWGGEEEEKWDVRGKEGRGEGRKVRGRKRNRALIRREGEVEIKKGKVRELGKEEEQESEE